MQAINGFENVQAVHGRMQPLAAGPHIIQIQAVSEDVTGYGNRCLKLVYDIAEGQDAWRFADIAGDPSMNWRHEVELDLQEQNGARLKALVDAMERDVPGFAAAFLSDWNEQRFVNQIVGVVFQERLQTNTRGKRKGQTSRYLDLWDFVPASTIRSGEVNYAPPVNDKRTNKGEQPAQPTTAPVAAPANFGQQQPAPQAAPQAPVAPQAPMQQPMPQQFQQQYQQPQAPMPMQQNTVTGVYDQDIPF